MANFLSRLKSRYSSGAGPLPKPSPWLFIALPTLVAGIYLGFIASEQYAATSQFIIKQSNSQAPPIALGIPFLGNKTSTSAEDALIIKDHIYSTEMFEKLEAQLDLIKHYNDPVIDRWSRLPQDASREDKLEYFNKLLSVSIDPDSAIVSLNTRAFTPEMAAAVNSSILTISENFINEISISLAEAQVDFVRHEVEKAEANLASARTKTLAFQSKYNLLDPESESVSLFGRISEMEAKLTEKRTELKTLSSFLQEDSPRIATVKREITALESQIKEETRMLAGTEELSLNQIMAQHQELKIEQEFALNTYTSALASLETARTDASRQMKFLIIVSDTGVPEEASQPKAVRGTLTIFVIASLIFFVIRLIVATINDHNV